MKIRSRSLIFFAGMMTQSVHSADLTLTSSLGTQASNFNLTTMNSEVNSVIDWVVWGEGTDTNLAGSNRKSGGSAISSLTVINPSSQPLRGLGQFSMPETFQWSDGSPTGNASNVSTSIQLNTNVPTEAETLNSGFSLNITGSTSETRRVYLWVGSHSGTTTFTATLNGASPVSFNLAAPQNDSAYSLLK